MVLELLAALFSGLLAFLKRIGHKDAPTQVADEANRGARQAAETARQTSTTLNEELSRAQRDIEMDRALVRHADSLRDLQSATQDAIDRANGDVS